MSKPLPKDAMEEFLHKKQYWLPVTKADETAASKTSIAGEKIFSVY
jgi:hypothetical protein